MISALKGEKYKKKMLTFVETEKRLVILDFISALENLE